MVIKRTMALFHARFAESAFPRFIFIPVSITVFWIFLDNCENISFLLRAALKIFLDYFLVKHKIVDEKYKLYFLYDICIIVKNYFLSTF